MNKKQLLCAKIIAVWDELCRHKPTIIQDAKHLSYSFIVNENKLLTLSLTELKLMEKYVYSHFQKKNINAEEAMADIGSWTFTECDDSLLIEESSGKRST
jgi:hypothetical protein